MGDSFLTGERTALLWRNSSAGRNEDRKRAEDLLLVNAVVGRPSTWRDEVTSKSCDRSRATERTENTGVFFWNHRAGEIAIGCKICNLSEGGLNPPPNLPVAPEGEKLQGLLTSEEKKIWCFHLVIDLSSLNDISIFTLGCESTDTRCSLLLDVVPPASQTQGKGSPCSVVDPGPPSHHRSRLCTPRTYKAAPSFCFYSSSFPSVP